LEDVKFNIGGNLASKKSMDWFEDAQNRLIDMNYGNDERITTMAKAWRWSYVGL
jgi:hypothetical protein